MHFLSVESLLSEALPLRIYRCLCQFFAWNYASDFILRIHVSMMWRLQGSGAIFVCWVSVKLRLLFTAGPYWQVVSARYSVWIFIDLWNLRPQNACSLSFLRPALKICVKNAEFCVNANPARTTKLLGGYISFTLFVRPSIPLSRILCSLCSVYSSGWFHFIFIHLIRQLQKVCHV